MRRVRATVTGRVQGVGFRYWALRAARDLGLTGWVRNLSDGGVEAEAQGPDAGVAAFLDSLKDGPPGARVSRVDAGEVPVQAGESDFLIE